MESLEVTKKMNFKNPWLEYVKEMRREHRDALQGSPQNGRGVLSKSNKS